MHTFYIHITYVCIHTLFYVSTYVNEEDNKLIEKQVANQWSWTNWTLGIMVTLNRMKGTQTFSRWKLVEEILRNCEIANDRPIIMLIILPYKLPMNDGSSSAKEEQIMNSIPYWKTLGNIGYVVSCMCPNLLFSVGFFSRFMH